MFTEALLANPRDGSNETLHPEMNNKDDGGIYTVGYSSARKQNEKGLFQQHG